MAINPIIKQKAEDIRKKIFGSEVRESLASGIEAISEDVEATVSRQDYVEEQFQNVIDETTGKDVISAPELIAARNGKSNLKTRLDEEHAQVTAQLQQTEQELNAQLAEKVDLSGSGQIGWANISQDAREQIIGTTPPAVVGVDSVLELNITNNAVTPSKTNFINTTKPYNIFNKTDTDIVDGYYADGDTHHAYASMFISGFIPCKPNDTIRFKMYQTDTGTVYGNFYDVNKTRLVKAIGPSVTAGSIAELVVPSTPAIAYVKLNLFINRKNQYVITINNPFPSIHVPYSNPINNINGVIGFSDKIEKSGNLYSRINNCVDGFYIKPDGYLATSNQTSYAIIKVKPNKEYVIQRPAFNSFVAENYGAISYLDSNYQIVSSFELSSLDGGYYNGLKYGIFTTPDNSSITYLVVNVKFNDDSDSRDSFILVEGNQLTDETIDDAYALSMFDYKFRDDYARTLAKGPASGKVWGTFGDSLTEKNFRAVSSYHDYISAELGFVIKNYGVSGSGYKNDEVNGNAFYQRMLDIDGTVDVLTIFGSGNDMYHGYTLGTVTDTTTDTLCGCINTTIDNFYSKTTNSKIGIITPTPWAGYPPSNTSNEMALYSAKLVEICQLRGIPCLDLYHCSGLRPWIESFRIQYYNENGVQDTGTHPNSLGHKFIAPMIREFVKSLI